MPKRHKSRWLQVTLFDPHEELSMEMIRGYAKHEGFNSMHELYGVLREELDEFWDSVKDDDPDPEELLQIAAVALQGFVQLCSQGQAEMADKHPELFKVNDGRDRRMRRKNRGKKS